MRGCVGRAAWVAPGLTAILHPRAAHRRLQRAAYGARVSRRAQPRAHSHGRADLPQAVVVGWAAGAGMARCVASRLPVVSRGGHCKQSRCVERHGHRHTRKVHGWSRKRHTGAKRLGMGVAVRVRTRACRYATNTSDTGTTVATAVRALQADTSLRFATVGDLIAMGCLPAHYNARTA